MDMATSTQKVALFDAVEGGFDFTVGTAPIPEPREGEVRFRVEAYALNQADLLLTQGRHYTTAELPMRIGYEGCGVVDAIGTGVTRFRIGDRVTCLPNIDGPYSTGGEYALAREDFLTSWPEGWSAEQAASVWMQYLTPYFPFAELFPFPPGAWVMITAASGGTGLGSIRMAKLLGAKVIATTRTAAKAPMLEEHGADLVLSTEDDAFVEQVMAATGGEGVRLICDTLCGPYVERLTLTLAHRGILFIHGGLSGENVFSLPVLNLVHRAAGVFGYSLINELRRPEALIRARDFVADAITRGHLPPPAIDRVFPLADVREAYQRMREGRQTGKIVVRVAP